MAAVAQRAGGAQSREAAADDKDGGRATRGRGSTLDGQRGSRRGSRTLQ